jgi:P-type Cu+ transporter
VVLADFGVNRALPAFARTAVDVVPVEAGSFTFACGMNMVQGTLVVEPAGPAPAPGAPGDGREAEPEAAPSAPQPSEQRAPADDGDAEAAERKAEIGDLSGGVIITLILLGRLLEVRAKAGTGEGWRPRSGVTAGGAQVPVVMSRGGCDSFGGVVAGGVVGVVELVA